MEKEISRDNIWWIQYGYNWYSTSTKSQKQALEEFIKYCNKLGLKDIERCLSNTHYYPYKDGWRFEITSDIFYKNMRYLEQEYKYLINQMYPYLNPTDKLRYLRNRTTLDDFDTEI